MHGHCAYVVSVLGSILLTLTWTAAPAAEPEWQARVLYTFCRDYTTAVTQVARARQEGYAREDVRAWALAYHIPRLPMSQGTLRAELHAINAVYRGPVLTPARWETRAWVVCLASDLKEEHLLR